MLTGRGGSGHGLAIARRIFQEDGGMIRLQAAEATGTQAIVELPAAPE